MEISKFVTYNPSILPDCIDLGIGKYAMSENMMGDKVDVFKESLIDCIITRINTAMPLPRGFKTERITNKDDENNVVFKSFLNNIYKPINNSADIDNLIMNRTLLDASGLMLTITVHHTSGLTAIYKTMVDGVSTLFITDALCFNIDVLKRNVDKLFNLNDIIDMIYDEIIKKLEYRGEAVMCVE
ncbi:MAG: hypothetical protein ACRC92_11295 [Peptostreptococcaceae bacterium]